MARFVGAEARGTWWWKELPEEAKAGGLSQFCKQQVQSAMTSKPQEHCSTGGKGQWGNQKAGSCCIGPQGNAAPLPGKRQGGRTWQARAGKTWTPVCQTRKERRRNPTHQCSGRKQVNTYASWLYWFSAEILISDSSSRGPHLYVWWVACRKYYIMQSGKIVDEFSREILQRIM